MLNVMRDNLRHLKWVLWLVAIAMVLSLGYYFSGSARRAGDEGWVARVNGEVITEDRLRTTGRNIDDYYRKLFGADYDNIRSQIRIGTQAVQALIDNSLMLQDARRLGIVASKEDIAHRIRTDPSLQTPDGQFIGEEQYLRVAQRYLGGVPAYERTVADGLIIDRWTDLVTQGVSVDDEELEKLYRERTEKTAFDYVVVASADQEYDTQVGDDQARAYYDAHAEDYARPAGRRVRFVVVDREAMSKQIAVGPEEVQAAYEADQARYSHPAQRRARHILVRVPPGASEEDKQAARRKAQSILDRVKAGQDFETLARELSEDPVSAERGGDLGFFQAGDMVPPFEKAVFDTPVGQLAPLTETDFGFHVIQVTDAREAGVTPLEEVQDEIRRSLLLARAQERVAAEADRLREAIGSAEHLDEVAAAEGLEVQRRVIREGDTLMDLGASPEFVPAVFALQPGQISQPLRLSAGLALVTYDEAVPAAVAPYEEVESKVRTDLLNTRARDAARERARRAMQRHPDLAAAAKSLGLTVQSSGNLSPGKFPPQAGGGGAEYMQQLFGDDVNVGDHGVVPVPAGALIYQVTLREPYNALGFQVEKPKLTEEVLGQRKEQLRQAILARLREQQDIEINQPIVARMDGA